MLASQIVWLLVASGGITALAGFAAFAAPRLQCSIAFGVEDPAPATVFFVRHWGVLVLVVGVLIVAAAYAPALRFPVLAGAAIEKFAIVALVFFGPLKRTAAMTAIACMDGAFAILYVAYLTSG